MAVPTTGPGTGMGSAMLGVAPTERKHLGAIADIVARGTALGVDYGRTVSCYQPDAEGRACGKCDSCRLRRAWFKVGVEIGHFGARATIGYKPEDAQKRDRDTRHRQKTARTEEFDELFHLLHVGPGSCLRP